jgi:hypothetical protein
MIAGGGPPGRARFARATIVIRETHSGIDARKSTVWPTKFVIREFCSIAEAALTEASCIPLIQTPLTDPRAALRTIRVSAC